MHKFKVNMQALCVLLFITAVSCLSVREEETTQSPFFHVSNEKHVENLPLKATRADVTIQGPIAQVKVTQLYQNRGTEVIEALYVFPASTRATVYGMQMLVNDRLLIANLYEKQEARTKYEEAKSQGKTASLLEMARPNVCSMSVANIMPGDYVRVEIFYTEMINPQDGKYTFVYPAVAMPRYESPNTGKSAPLPSTSYTHQGEPETYEFQFSFDIISSVPLSDVYSPTHIFDYKRMPFAENLQLTIPAGSEYSWKGSLSPLSAAPGTKDVKLVFSLSGPDFTGGLINYSAQGDDGFAGPFRLTPDGNITWDLSNSENFFMAMIQPPKPQLIPSPLPREYIFILDSSGSMHGFPWSTSLVIFQKLVEKLRSDVDYFNLMSFSDTNIFFSNSSLKATTGNIKSAVAWIGNMFGGGGTNMDIAVKEALAMPSTDSTLARTYCMLTDGGISNEDVILDLIRANLREANFFCFVIGPSPNRFLSQGVARVGKGEEYWVRLNEDPQEYVDQFYKFSGHPLLSGVKVEIHPSFDAYDVNLPAGILLANRPVIISGKYRGTIPSPALAVTGWQANGVRWEKEISRTENDFRPSQLRMLKYYWVGEKINDLRFKKPKSRWVKEETDDDREMIALALQYGVLTELTSFLAIDNVVRFNVSSTTVFSVNQPLPLPEGVSDSATGDFWDVDATPEDPNAQPTGYPSSYNPRVPSFSFGAASSFGPTLPILVVLPLYLLISALL